MITASDLGHLPHVVIIHGPRGISYTVFDGPEGMMQAHAYAQKVPSDSVAIVAVKIRACGLFSAWKNLGLAK